MQSWIPPSFAWTTASDVFLIDVQLSDPDIVEFISTGVCELAAFGTRKMARLTAMLLASEGSLKHQLQEAVWAGGKLKPIGPSIKSGAKIFAHCHGIFLLGDGETLCVMVGGAKPLTFDVWISPEIKAEANVLMGEHRARVAEFEDAIKRRKQENDALKERYHSDPHFGAWGDASTGMEEIYQRPVVTAASLLQFLPRAAKFVSPTSGDPEKTARAATNAIAASNWPESREGDYTGIIAGVAGRRAQGLVSWVPHTGLTSYPDVRWAVQKRLPAALRKPRIKQIDKAQFDTGTKLAEDSVQVQGFDPNSNDLKDALEELQFDQSDHRDQVKNIRKDVKEHGFEAIAWFQPYHVWTEETWGIYFDARKLDDLALSFLDDFQTQRVHGSHGLAALLAFGLIYAHELFHARVEAALSWQEINAQQPRHLRYKERVYQALRETPEWLEEALANWSAWNWFHAQGTQSLLTGRTSSAKSLERVVEASLDLSPPGYRDWRLGHQRVIWRTFANQLSTGNPKIAATGAGLPLESALTGPLPYDFRPSDIPLHFVGAGVIADRLQIHPATFNVPPRREMERALKHFRHTLDASGGKGGHQKWTGPDQRAFILPTRDPVSTGVFKTFLHHVGIDKATYVRQVRPNL